jgi:hypothetical protein
MVNQQSVSEDVSGFFSMQDGIIIMISGQYFNGSV